MLKDHVSRKGRKLEARLNKLYNLNLTDFEHALMGTPAQMEAACQKIGQVGRESQIMLELLPQIKEHFTANIQATTQYNQARADLLKQTAGSAIAIDRAAMQTSLAQKQYGHKRSELAREWVVANGLEQQRHTLEVNYIQLKGIAANALARVDGEAKLIEQVNQPALKQIDENLNHQRRVVNHVLAKGNASNTELLHQKQYVTASNPIQTFFESAAKKMGFLV